MADEKIINITGSHLSLFALTNFGNIYKCEGNEWRRCVLPELHKVKKKKEDKLTYGLTQKVKMTEEQYKKLCEDYGKRVVDDKIISLEEYIVNRKRHYADHFLTLNKWLLKDNDKQTSSIKEGTYLSEGGSTRRDL